MLAIAGGVVIGGIALWVARLLLGIGLMSAVASGLNVTVGDPPGSSVTAGAAYKRQLAKERGQQIESRRVPPIDDALRRKREQSERGRQYWTQCEEWSRNYKMTPTETTRLNGKFYCERYGTYIETGRTSNDKPPF
ncbi:MULTISPECIES: hypothetical protein [unclassified Salinisphaera]|uniref:hypothetical protein n=1 Tax=unclassified Salinisphaera TaxID=2649847 RepID=UPI00333E8A25